MAETMGANGAPFRADHVGSLLRPPAVQAARKAHLQDGTVDAEALRAAEDAAIRTLVTRQQEAGLPVVTDGEARRSFWHYDFIGALDGFELVERGEGVAFAGKRLRPIHPTITGPVDFPDDHPMLEHFRYLASLAEVMPKISIPGPSCCHFRTAKADIGPEMYRDTEVLFADIAAAYRKAVAAFYAIGCRYLQMDDIFFAYLCDPKHRAEKEAAGEDPDDLIAKYAWMMEEAIRDRPADMVIGMHLCRGNFQSTHAAEGGYDAVADAIFNRTSVDIYFMEYDTERAGDLTPLRHLPKGRKRVLPGFITTKHGTLESVDAVRRQIDAAGRHADIAQLGIAPQCGFASTEEGNLIDEDDQWRKLARVVEVAEAVWGTV
ncbi:MAG: 5-methyltetrahydropteroyltriglutamate--homocysteine S-methyltransferase [Pseudomonadota bacterium]